MRFVIALRQVDDNLHCAVAPDLPGCRAVGSDREQAILYARRAIDAHCRSLADEGEPIPEPRSREQHTPLTDWFDEANWTCVDVAIEQYFVR